MPKREKYFSGQCPKELYDIIQNQFPGNDKKIDFSSASLIVLDMQKYFLDENSHAFIPGANMIVKGITRLIELFLSGNRPVILTRHINDDSNAMMMSKWWGDLITENNSYSEIVDDLRGYNLPVLKKSQYDAFHNTELDAILKLANVEQIVITGVMTHLCCETTARSAFVYGYEVFFPVDGTATYNQDFHRASLVNLAHGFAHISTVEKLLRG